MLRREIRWGGNLSGKNRGKDCFLSWQDSTYAARGILGKSLNGDSFPVVGEQV